MNKVLDVFPSEALGALQFAVVEDEADPEVVHEGRETEHHGSDTDGSSELFITMSVLHGSCGTRHAVERL